MSFHPQTPQSPSQFSPSSMEPSLSMNTSMTSMETLPTPAHSVSGSSVPSEMAHDGGMSEDSSQKRKRPIDDLGDRQQKKVHIEDSRIGIEALHENVGEKYLLCRTQHKPTLPRLSDDLFEAFGLTDIATEVARTNPDGSKNAIRKTYKGHIKTLGINGHFDSNARDLEKDGQNHFVFGLMWIPEDNWMATQVRTKEIWNGFAPEVQSKLGAAMTMAKGPLSKSDWDSSVLGELASDKVSGVSRQAARGTAPNTPLHLGISRPKVQESSAQEAKRPQRATAKKRGYGDNSYEGYAEGFPDDEAGYSTGEGDDRGAGQKRRKKVLDGLLSHHCPRADIFQNAVPSQFGGGPVRQTSYGPGMVGA